LKGQQLQVLTEIVDYKLRPLQYAYSGEWHVEGMPNDEIVATAIYILDRDDDLVGGFY
jgi:hypothetical protein